MKFHKEGRIIIIATFAALAAFVVTAYFSGGNIALYFTLPVALILLVLVLQFFRVPTRSITSQEGAVICPSDGKVVVIEETDEGEYFKDRRIQVSIFMSPLNVHINWFPISGKVKYSKYHPGKYLVAWHPKSSTDNERTTVVVENSAGVSVLFRQIAGAVARRIVCYANVGDQATQGSEFGFIKFGSRVDVFLPVGSEIKVQLNQLVQGSVTTLAILPTKDS
jgi:phosphatidylserine decarboxylase